MNSYQIEVKAKCPANPLTLDVYQFTIECPQTIMVEDLIAFFKPYETQAILQEELTEACYKKFIADVTSTGTHSGVKTKCVVRVPPVLR